jgi:hypothetical protein
MVCTSSGTSQAFWCRAEPCDLCAAGRIHVGRATSGSAGEEPAICGVAWQAHIPVLLLVASGGQSVTNYARMYRFGITPWER